MAIKDALIAELKHESNLTRKALERLPEEHFSWKPHEKSYSLGELATHIARLYSWLGITLTTPELDFADPENRKNSVYESKAELLSEWENNVIWGLEELNKIEPEALEEKWTLRNGEHEIFSIPRKVSIRYFVYNHITHHRGQLMVYYRLLNIPVPGLYGPSADEAGL